MSAPVVKDSTGTMTRVPVHFADEDEEEEGRVGESILASTLSTPPPPILRSSTTRVAIIDDDSDADDVPALPTTTSTVARILITAPTPSHFTGTSSSSSGMNDITTPTKITAACTSQLNSTSSAKKAKKTSEAKKIPSTAPITSCYELERELEVASKDLTLIARVFERVKRTEVKTLLSNLLEPTVIYRLLNAVFLHFGTKSALKVVKWYATVAATKKFSIQYGLLDEAYKVVLRAHLQCIYEFAVSTAGDIDSLHISKVVEVQALY